ncbi:MAG: hypothetical protein HQL65_04200 [Magnetococcales bacterium]|nr:hypothetical protein [Magnetococcales bacterium]
MRLKMRGSWCSAVFLSVPIVVATGAIKHQRNHKEVFMCSNEPLKDLLDTLQALKMEMRDAAEPGVRQRLDEAIEKIQSILSSREYSDDEKKSRVLSFLGQVMDKLPSIVNLLKMFSDF